MPFISHTGDDVREILAVIGAERTEDLFGEIPAALRAGELSRMPEALREMEVIRLMSDTAARDKPVLNFIDAGAYEHHIPAAVW